jgi:hypothetical protein
MVCAESCALTDADLFLLELVQQDSMPTDALSNYPSEFNPV